jgi:hypothetical protein
VRNLSSQSGQVNFKVSGLEGVIGDEVVADAGVIGDLVVADAGVTAEEGERSGAVDAKLRSVFAEPGVALDCGLEAAFCCCSKSLICGDGDVAI